MTARTITQPADHSGIISSVVREQLQLIEDEVADPSSIDPGHLHTPAGVSATGTPDATTFWRGDNTWSTPPGEDPGGSDTQLQYNDGGSFGGITGATSDGTTVTLTSPTFVTPALGTPASGTLTNATGLPLTTGITGTLGVGHGGTGVTSISALSVWVANSADTITQVTPSAGDSIRINGAGTAWETFTPSAGVPTTITVANEATDTTCFVGFFTAATGDLGPKSNSNLTFNSNTGRLGVAQLEASDDIFSSGGGDIYTDGGDIYTTAGDIYTSSGSITGDDLVGNDSLTLTGTATITIADTQNEKGLIIYQNDVTNDPLALQVGPDSAKVTAQTLVQFSDAAGANSDWAFNVAGNGAPIINFQSTGGTLGSPTASNTGIKSSIDTYIYNSTPAQKKVTGLTFSVTNITAGAEEGFATFFLAKAGTYSAILNLNSSVLYPNSNDLVALGSGGNAYSDLFLAEGGVINWDNGDVTLTQTNNVLALAGTSDFTMDTVLRPANNDGGTLGSATVSWADVFLASGAVLNYANGNVVLTHSSGILTMGTGELRITTAGTNSASVPTLGSTSTLTNKTLTSPTITTASLSGTQLLAEGGSIGLDPSLSADGTYTGVTITGTAGATLAFGDLIYLDPTDSRWELTDANSAAAADGDARGTIGICVLAAASDGDPTTILLSGAVRADTAFPTFTVNNPIYVSETAGDVTQTQPTTSGVVIRVLGAALTADAMLFNPDQTWVTHT